MRFSLKGERWGEGCCPKLGTQHSPIELWVSHNKLLSCDNILSTSAEAV